MSTEFAGLDAEGANAALARWLPIFQACFSGPPWHEDVTSVETYRVRINAHLKQNGLTAQEAQVDGRTVGVAYGWPSARELPDLPFYSSFVEAVGADVAESLVAQRPFELVELMVDPPHRGNGLARALLERILPDERPSWLATDPGSDAAAMYAHLGWTPLGTANDDSGPTLQFFARGFG